MIGIVNNEIIRLWLKFWLLHKFFADSVVTKVSGSQSLDVIYLKRQKLATREKSFAVFMYFLQLTGKIFPSYYLYKATISRDQTLFVQGVID